MEENTLVPETLPEDIAPSPDTVQDGEGDSPGAMGWSFPEGAGMDDTETGEEASMAIDGLPADSSPGKHSAADGLGIEDPATEDFEAEASAAEDSGTEDSMTEGSGTEDSAESVPGTSYEELYLLVDEQLTVTNELLVVQTGIMAVILGTILFLFLYRLISNMVTKYLS